MLFVVLYSGCEKPDNWKRFFPEEVHLPGEYFPAYPNTWWEYHDYRGNVVKYEISHDYLLCEGSYSPVFLNIDRCIYGSELIFGFGAPKAGWVTVGSPIYSTVLNDTMWCPVSMATFKETSPVDLVEFRRVTTAKDTSVTLSNDDHYTEVIVVEEFSIIDPYHRYVDYFAKDVGLIRRDSLNPRNPAVGITILTLQDYYIGDKDL